MRYLAVYRDNATAKIHYYGPFVSIPVADEFLSTLPEPDRGGAKGVKVLSPYTSNEADIARDVILRARVRSDPHTATVSQIVARTQRSFQPVAHSR